MKLYPSLVHFSPSPDSGYEILLRVTWLYCERHFSLLISFFHL